MEKKGRKRCRIQVHGKKGLIKVKGDNWGIEGEERTFNWGKGAKGKLTRQGYKNGSQWEAQGCNIHGTILNVKAESEKRGLGGTCYYVGSECELFSCLRELGAGRKKKEDNFRENIARKY